MLKSSSLPASVTQQIVYSLNMQADNCPVWQPCHCSQETIRQGAQCNNTGQRMSSSTGWGRAETGKIKKIWEALQKTNKLQMSYLKMSMQNERKGTVLGY